MLGIGPGLSGGHAPLLGIVPGILGMRQRRGFTRDSGGLAPMLEIVPHILTDMHQ